MIEVEVKARVDALERMARALDGMARPAGEVDYHDVYFTPAGEEGYSFRRFRLRRDGGTALVTVKERIGVEGCEASREHEFEVGDAEAFAEFARVFGFKVLMEKHKHGRRWKVDGSGATVDLVTVDGLGGFVEIEIMVEDEGEVDEARDEVTGLLARLGVPADAVEPRPYTLMLWESGENK